MIVYLEKRGVPIEVPDDIGDKDLEEIDKNFDSMVAEPASPSQVKQSAEIGNTNKTESINQPGRKWVPDFFKSRISGTDILKFAANPILASTEKMITTGTGRAYTGKALEQFTFGLTKPLLDERLSADYKNHPVASDVGSVVGGVGSLLSTYGALNFLGLGAKSAKLAQESTKIGQIGSTLGNITAKFPRFLPPAIMQGATLGTKKFIEKTVESLQEGRIDPVEYGSSILKETAVGSILGSISGLTNVYTAVSSAAGIGYLYSKSEGADHREALLNSAIWATFELVGSHGREYKLRVKAKENLEKTISEYIQPKFEVEGKPIPKETSDAIAKTIVDQQFKKIGGVDEVLKSQKGTLQAIENINQVVSQGKVEIKQPMAVEQPLLGVKPKQEAGIPPKSEIIPATEEKAIIVPRGNEETVKIGKNGIPEREPNFVVKEITAPNGEKIEITHQMAVNEAEALMDSENEMLLAKESDPVRDLIFRVKLKPEGPDQLGEFKDLPLHVKDLKNGLTPSQIVQRINESPLDYGIPEGTEITINDVYEKAQKRAISDKNNISQYYDRAINELEGMYSDYGKIENVDERPFSGVEPTNKEVEVEPGVFFEKPGKYYPSEKAQIIDSVYKNFGKTNDISKAGFILDNGDMVDFSGKGDDSGKKILGNRYYDHTNIIKATEFTGTEKQGFDSVIEFLNKSGAARISYNFNDLMVQTVGIPSNEIKDQVKNAIIENKPKRIFFDEINENGRTVKSREYVNPDENSVDSFYSPIGERKADFASQGSFTENVQSESPYENPTTAKEASEPSTVDGFRALNKPHLKVEFKKVGSIIIPNRKIQTPADLAYAFKELKNEAQENFYIAAVKDNELISIEHLGFGTIDQVAVYPYETLNFINDQDADSYFVVHNHPSGEVSPSEDDKRLTRNLKKAITGQGKKYLGHVIINDTKFGYNNPDADAWEIMQHNKSIGEMTEEELAAFGKSTKDIPVLRKYFEWSMSKSDISKNPSITSPNSAFEIFKGIQTGESEAVVYLLNTQNKLLNGIVIPKNAITSALLAKLATSYRASSIVTLNTGIDARKYNELKSDLINVDVRLMDDIEISEPNSYKSKREYFGETKSKYSAKENQDLFNIENENISSRYERLRSIALSNGMNPSQAAKWAKEKLRQPQGNDNTANKPTQQEFSQPGGVSSFGKGREGEQDLFEEKFKSTRTGQRNYGTKEDIISELKKKFGGIEYVKKLQGPELVKLAKFLTGDVPTIKRVMHSLGYFKPSSNEIALFKDIFKDPKEWEAVLAHEIGHALDFNPDKTMKRGNVLGRIATLKKYRKSLLPESPESKESILTDEDRRKFRAQAEKISKGEKSGGSIKNEPDNKFDPQMILDVWNAVTPNVDPELINYIKGIDANAKKELIKSAMQALKKGEKITVYDVNKFNKDAGTNLKSVADIYRDILKKEIQKRKLWEEEVIREEMQNLSQYWKPFDQTNTSYRKYRFSSPELYADFISVILNAPRKALEIAPKTYEAFFNYLQNKPEAMKQYLELQSLVQGSDDDLQKIRVDDLIDMFEKGEQASRKIAIDNENAKKSSYDKLRTLFIDKNSMLLDERNKLAKNESLPPENDAKYLVEKYSMTASFVKSFLDKFDNQIYGPASSDPETLKATKLILFLDRIKSGDRSEVANPKGHTPETAKDALEYLKKTNPEKYAQAEKFAEDSRKWLSDISKIEGANDFYTPEQLALIQQSDKYAPLRIIEYMKDYISAGFNKQFGTFKDSSDPMTNILLKGTSQLVAIERNRIIKNIVENTLLKSGITMVPAEIKNYPGTFNVNNPPNKNMGTILYKSNGKWMGYHTDKYISDIFNNKSSENIQNLSSAINSILLNKAFRNMFITFNTSFQSVNLIRDFIATWKAVPDMTISQALKLYANSLPEAKKRVSGEYSELINQMEKSGALNITYNNLILGKNAEDNEIERHLMRYGKLDNPENKYKGIPVIKQLSQIMDFIRYTGDVIETLPKVAGWKSLENMPEEKRAYYVRNYIGTPSTKRTGTATPVTNSFFMFSNIAKEGIRNMIELATSKDTRKTYWSKTFESAIFPKILMGMIAAGYFGKKAKEVMDKNSEYMKTNYIVIPMGVDENGNGISITIPQDEAGRLVGGIFWKMINSKGNVKQNLSDLFAFGEGAVPSMSPAISISKAWAQYLSGKNPTDTFRGGNILTDQEQEAGGKYAFEPMARWTMNQSGWVRLDIRDRLKDEPLYKKMLGFTPILNRFIRVGRAGESEIARNASGEVRSKIARENIDIKNMARKAIRMGIPVEDFIEKAENEKMAKKMKNSYELLKKGYTSDPWISALNRATSNEEKMAILEKAKQTYANMEKFNDYVDSLYEDEIISGRLALEIRE
ncbi:MAG: JAB domain-containing protein [Alphaproteobacteria bacterium]|nr:JAB domain-containing protein [Alphaproteobacteria bacterium]